MYSEQEILTRQEELKNEIESLRGKIKELPEGKLIYSNYKGYTNWSRYVNGREEYIPKKEKGLAVKLAEKRWYECRLKDALREQEALSEYQRIIGSPNQCEKAFLENPNTRQLLENTYLLPDEQQQQWATADYERSNYREEDLIYSTLKGDMVRSKSEVLIADTLFRQKIAYRYEEKIQLEGGTVVPDFRIMHSRTGEIKYLEHCGKMDDMDYLQRFIKKLWLYAKNGIYLGEQLIITLETAARPLDIHWMHQIVQNYF